MLSLGCRRYWVDILNYPGLAPQSISVSWSECVAPRSRLYAGYVPGMSSEGVPTYPWGLGDRRPSRAIVTVRLPWAWQMARATSKDSPRSRSQSIKVSKASHSDVPCHDPSGYPYLLPPPMESEPRSLNGVYRPLITVS